jgi:hypothetical protein
MTKQEMNLALTHPSYFHINSSIKLLNDVMANFLSNNESQTSHYKAAKSVFDIRHVRMVFMQDVPFLLAEFSKQEELLQVETELYFYKAVKKLDQLMLIANQEIKESSLQVFNRHLLKEFKETVSILSEIQEQMSRAPYTDNTDKILGDPKLYSELVDAWGDLANDGY